MNSILALLSRRGTTAATSGMAGGMMGNGQIAKNNRGVMIVDGKGVDVILLKQARNARL